MAPSGPKQRSLGKRKGSPSHPLATTSDLPSIVSRSKEGTLDSATQMTPPASTAKPLVRPVFLITVLFRPSELNQVTQPRSAAASTISQVPSGRATGPSGAPRSPAKIIEFLQNTKSLLFAHHRHTTLTRLQMMRHRKPGTRRRRQFPRAARGGP